MKTTAHLATTERYEIRMDAAGNCVVSDVLAEREVFVFPGDGAGASRAILLIAELEVPVASFEAPPSAGDICQGLAACAIKIAEARGEIVRALSEQVRHSGQFSAAAPK